MMMRKMDKVKEKTLAVMPYWPRPNAYFGVSIVQNSQVSSCIACARLTDSGKRVCRCRNSEEGLLREGISDNHQAYKQCSLQTQGEAE